MKYVLFTLFTIFTLQGVIAQNTVVQTLNFNSQTRDTRISFPEGDHNQYEKILMHYGMRCKDGLVSDLNDRNKGCGEWDFSNNTYIVDSTKVDSLKETDLDVVISSYDVDSGPFQFTSNPTYVFTQTTLREVRPTSGSPVEVPVFSEGVAIEPPFGINEGVSMTVLIKREELGSMVQGDLTALKLLPISGNSTLDRLVIELQQVEMENVDENIDETAWSEVFRNTETLEPTGDRLYFHTPFAYDGSSDILIRLQYDGIQGVTDAFLGETTAYTSVDYKVQAYDQFANFGEFGSITVDTPMPEVSQQVTVSFWHFGGDQLPQATAVFEAVDNDQNRQMNVHLPWGNGTIFWDCGNDGSGWDRISKPASPAEFKGQWNHWAFTKNASTGEMKIFLNGDLWHSATGRGKLIDIQGLRVASSFIPARRSYASLSDFSIWNKALDETEIEDLMARTVTAAHPSYDNLILHYALDDLNTGVAEDLSPSARDGVVEGTVQSRPWNISTAVSNQFTSSIAPAMTFDQGNYTTDIVETIVIDSLENLPNRVERYVLDGTTRVLEDTEFLYEAKDQPIFDQDGNLIGQVPVTSQGEISPMEIEHFTKTPMVFEIMSFVTPYGIFLDLEDGKTWTFDVTHLGPILKGNKRMFMSQGGEWQEEMNVWFEFIEGEPIRDVIDVQQIWPCRVKTDRSLIMDDRRFEPRLLTYDPAISKYLARTVITGHGQQGEFVPRTHFLEIGGFKRPWQVWTECAGNPIFPQGGTWIFDRAGWCPGQASDVRFTDLTEFLEFADEDERIIDYGIEFVDGASNYLVNSQLITYGPLNRATDIEMLDIINPSEKVEHGRFNPGCKFPTITLRNNGSDNVNSVMIRYGIEGGETFTHEFSGVIFPENNREILLNNHFLPLITENSTFFAEVVSVNGGTDEYAANDRLTSEMQVLDHFGTDIVIELRTNAANFETTYKVFDEERNVVLFVNGSTQAFTTVRDTLFNLNGCYTLEVTDIDGDGLDFFANNDGIGFLRLRELGGATKVIEPDFGSFVNYGFTAGLISSTEEELEDGLSLFPNPTDGKLYVTGLGDWSSQVSVQLYDQTGKLFFSSDSLDKYQLVDGQVEGITNLPNGLYYITIRDDQRIQTRSFVKQK